MSMIESCSKSSGNPLLNTCVQVFPASLDSKSAWGIVFNGAEPLSSVDVAAEVPASRCLGLSGLNSIAVRLTALSGALMRVQALPSSTLFQSPSFEATRMLVGSTNRIALTSRGRPGQADQD